MNMKKLLKYTFITVFVAIGGYGVYTSQTVNEVSDLVLANIEALADDTESSGGYNYVYYPVPGDANYGYTKCVCSGNGSLSCC